jgi:hypothetical protein
MTYYLKTTDEAALWLALESAGLAKRYYNPEDPANIAPEDSEGWTPTGSFEWQRVGQYDLDIIGPIFKPTGEMLLGEDDPYPEMEQLDGYHANIRGITAEQAEQLPIITKPTNPVRIWAGD